MAARQIYLAANPDSSTALQITNLPDSIINVNGGFLYVTEIFTRHNLITPLDRLLPYGVSAAERRSTRFGLSTL